MPAPAAAHPSVTSTEGGLLGVPVRPRLPQAVGPQPRLPAGQGEGLPPPPTPTAAVIDNLVKGASGQAIQNMNLLFGLPEETALMQQALFP